MIYKMICKVSDNNKIIGCLAEDVNGRLFAIRKDQLGSISFSNVRITSDLRVIGNIPVITKSDAECKLQSTKDLVLYHGSHSGIVGTIKPNLSRDACDFGQGFYAGDIAKQAMTVICDDVNGVFYTLRVNIYGLRVYRFLDDVQWALYVGVNRRHIDSTGYRKLCALVKNINSYDVVVGLIADDRMVYVYSRFIAGDITDKALIEALKYVRLGNQYVFKSDLACSRIKFESRYSPTRGELKQLKHDKSVQIGNLPKLINDLMIKYRRNGKYVDEILEDYR